MSYSKLILRDSAEIIWPLDDITNSSSISNAINFFSRSSSAYHAIINPNNSNVTNIPIIYGGNTALELKSSSICFSIPAIGRFSERYKDKNSVISFWLKVDDLSLEERPIFKKRGQNYCGLFIKENYLIFKFGKEADYSLIVGELINPEEPHHIFLSIGPSFRSMMIDGVTSDILVASDSFPSYDSNPNNDFLDFYGTNENSLTVDCPAYFPNILDDSIVKRHYVYGLGKWSPYDIFSTRGGTIYNFTTGATERNYSIDWDFPEEWQFAEYKNLSFKNRAVESIKFNEPLLLSFDKNISTINNEIKFSSASETFLSYIDIKNIQEKIGQNNAIFIKFKLPEIDIIENIPQRLTTFGQLPDFDLFSIDLELVSSSLQLRLNIIDKNESISFNMFSASPNSEFYVGFQFIDKTLFYLLENNNILQTASFNYYNEQGFGQDPLSSFYPFSQLINLRIGATNQYDLESSIPTDPFELNQFKGTFSKLLIVDSNDINNINSIQYLDVYKKSRYSVKYLTDGNRFKVSTYGEGEFYLHSIDLAYFLSDYNQKLDANCIEVGYPNIKSSSAVEFYVTQYNYSGSVVYPRTKIEYKNYLDFINNKNISGTYLKFDFNIYSDDVIYYPPRIQYFKIETFGSGEGKLLLRDKGGPPFYIYPNSSSVIYLPEKTWTPNIFITKNSGLKSIKNIIEFTPEITSVPLEPREVPNLILWLDARFPLGFRKNLPEDDSKINEWIDLSENKNQVISASFNSPIYRSQSLNLLTLNQLTGSDFNKLDGVNANNCLIQSSPNSIFGEKSISLIPTGSFNDSYINLSNTASITVFANQSYSVVGSIKLNKPQTASALHPNARKIIVFTTDGITEIFSASSISSLNSAGVYSLSAVFTTSSVTTGAILKFYNGSFNSRDIVYWDNLGLYPINSGSFQNIWVQPYSVSDRPTIKFDGMTTALFSTASITQPSSLYIVGRNFGNSIFAQSTSASILYSNSASYFVSYGSAQNYVVSDNSFHIFSIINNGTTTELFIDGVSVGSKNAGTSNIDQLIIGRQLQGDISAIVLYAGNHSETQRKQIEDWLNDSFLVY